MNLLLVNSNIASIIPNPSALVIVTSTEILEKQYVTFVDDLRERNWLILSEVHNLREDFDTMGELFSVWSLLIVC